MKQINKIESSFLIYMYKKPETIKVLLLVLFLSGMYFTYFFTSFLGISLSVLAVFYYTTSNGIILDLEKKRYQKARVFRNWTRGNWQDLPDISYVSVFKATMVSTTHSVSYRCVELKKKVVLINLIHDKNQRLNVFQTLDEKEGLQKAIFIAQKLDLPIYNATSRVGSWIERDQIQ